MASPALSSALMLARNFSISPESAMSSCRNGKVSSWAMKARKVAGVTRWMNAYWVMPKAK